MRTLNDIRAELVGQPVTVEQRAATIADIRQYTGSGQFHVDLSNGGMKVSNARRVNMKVIFKDSGTEQWIKGVLVE